MCDLTPVWAFDEDLEFKESEEEFFCTECGEFVSEPCEKEEDY